ncbi:hypothetical protein PGB90_007543 [Kerria lacca]
MTLSREKFLQLIDEFEKKEKLWNSTHEFYYNKLKTNDAWIVIKWKMEMSH